MTYENHEEEKGFTVTDRRFSSQTREEQDKADVAKEKSKIEEAEAVKKEAPQPEIDFYSFILSLSTSALVQLGKIGDPVTNKTTQNLPAAKQTIDILAIIQEKTKGNLTDQEQALLDNSLYDLRMMYISQGKQ
jgi:hypothetical protein